MKLNMLHTGPRFQQGFGYSSIGDFRGRGIGTGLFGNLMKKFILPTLKSTGKKIAKRAVGELSGLANDVIDGKSIKESAQKRLKKAQNELMNSVSNRFTAAPPGLPNNNKIKKKYPKGKIAKKKKNILKQNGRI